MLTLTSTLRRTDKVWDFGSSPRVPSSTLVANKVACVMRYVSTSSWASGLPFYSWKSITPEEVAEMHRLGIGVICLWEAGQNDPLQGSSKGVAHGKQALKSCAALGYPHGLPIIPAIDYDVTPANSNASAQYMQGFHGVLAADGRWATGVYGDTDIIKRCAAEGTASIFHMTGALAWSNRTVIDLVHLLQSISGSSPDWDNDYVLRDGVGMWLPHTAPDLPPVVLPPTVVPSPSSRQEITVPLFSEPIRIHDTDFDPGRLLNPDEQFRVDFGGTAIDVSVNLTVTRTTGPGFLTAAGVPNVGGKTSAVSWDRAGDSATGHYDGHLPDGGLYITFGPSGGQVYVDVCGQVTTPA